MQNPEKYYNPDREPDLRKTGRHKTPRRDLAPGEANRWSVTEMWDIHHEIARMLLIGWKNVDIAKKLDVSAVMVSAVRNSPVVQEKLALMHKSRDADAIDVAKEIKDFAPVALNLLKDIVEGDGDGEQASIGLRGGMAKDLLDRAGHGAIQKSMGLVGHLTAEDIEGLKKRAGMQVEKPLPETTPEI